MEEETKTIKKQKNIIVILCIIIALLLMVGIYMLFIKKENNSNAPSSNDVTEHKNNMQNEYKTADGKYTLKIVDENDSEMKEKARQIRYQEMYKIAQDNCLNNDMDDAFGDNELKCSSLDKDFDEYFKNNNTENDVKKYALLNDEIVDVLDFEEDDNYGMYYGFFERQYGNMPQYGVKFLVDKQKGIIIEKDNSFDNDIAGALGEDYARFTMENKSYNYIKTNAGYFFVSDFTYEPYSTIYTIDWKEVGYHNDIKNIQSDSDGIYVYKEYDANNDKLINLVKYSIK